MSLNGFPVFAVQVALASEANRNDSLDGIDTTHLDGGVLGWVRTGGAASQLFWLDKADVTTPPDGVTVVQPLTGPGRWKLLVAGAAPGIGCTIQSGLACPIENPATGENEICLENTNQLLQFHFPNRMEASGPGTPLEIPFPSFTADNVLEVTWSAALQIIGAPEDGSVITFSMAPFVAFPDGGGGESLFLINNFTQTVNFVEDNGYRVISGHAHVPLTAADLANGPPKVRLFVTYQSNSVQRVEVRVGVVDPDAGTNSEETALSFKASEIRASCLFQTCQSNLVAAGASLPDDPPFCGGE